MAEGLTNFSLSSNTFDIVSLVSCGILMHSLSINVSYIDMLTTVHHVHFPLGHQFDNES